MCSCSIGSADRSFSSRYQWLCVWISCRIAFPSFVRDTRSRSPRQIHFDSRAFVAQFASRPLVCIYVTLSRFDTSRYRALDSIRDSVSFRFVQAHGAKRARPFPRKRQFLFNYRASVIETKRSVLLQRARSSLRARIRKPGATYVRTDIGNRCYSTEQLLHRVLFIDSISYCFVVFRERCVCSNRRVLRLFLCMCDLNQWFRGKGRLYSARKGKKRKKSESFVSAVLRYSLWIIGYTIRYNCDLPTERNVAAHYLCTY